jgi:N-6 DNA Methylase
VFAEPNQQLDSLAPPEVRSVTAQGSVNLAVPRKGYVLSTAAELYGSPLRVAAAILGEAAPSEPVEAVWHKLYARRHVEPDAPQTRGPTELAAWMVVAAWAVGVASGCLQKDATLLEAESWFLGDVAESGFAALVPGAARLEAEGALHEVADRKALRDLLPYILDPHGEGSRMSVLLRPETAGARARKRAEGVFYTPADVAGFMAASIIRRLADDAMPLTVFDPACGSGVFLRAVLSELQRRSPGANAFDLACSCLYGTDIDPWAVNAAAFVVLADCFDEVQARGIAPLTAWHALRLNLAHVNALRLDPGRAVPHDDPERIARLECRAMLKAGKLSDVTRKCALRGSLEFQFVFPELAEGARIVIGNPPYANVGTGNDLLSLSKRFETFQAAPKTTSDMYPLFVEQITRLTAPNAHGGAMVLPLSIACNTGRQFLGLRRLLARTAGHWRFAFFDREPHALFGEDVKTRNAIVLWTRQGCEVDVRISTGPLRKWRSEDRARMLDSVSFTAIASDIRAGIPKIEGALQAEALTRLMAERHTLLHAVTHFGRATLSDAMRCDASTVFVAATAYNFLSVFLRPRSVTLNGAEELTENPMLALACPSREAALQVFALLSSKVAFWWWHAHGDGFHVSKHVIETMPVGEAFRDAAFAAELTRLGESLWEEVSASPVVSLNRGRTSLGFSAAASPQRERIDALLIEALGLVPEFAIELHQFCERVTNAHLSSRD